jgi:hypothetical protein
VLLALASAGCGYRLANGSSERITPELGEVSSPHAAIAAALLDGVREELGRHGVLASDGSALRVDLLRLDERAEGIVSASGAPIARAVRVTIVGRARLAAGRDTGDVEASEVVASAPSPEKGEIAADAAASAAARRLGARLARKVLGYPEP